MPTAPFNVIQEALLNAPVVDTHEHFRFPDTLGPMNLVALFRNSYLVRALHAADGLPSGLGGALDVSLDEDSWETVAKVVERVRMTAYYQWLIRGLAELYELPRVTLDRTTSAHLSAELKRRYADPTWLSRALDRANIRAAIWDINWKPGQWTSPEPRLVPSLRINSSVVALNADAGDSEGHNVIREWAAHFDMSIDSLADLEVLIDRLLEENVRAGARSLKSSIAYQRTLAVEASPRSEANRIFGRAENHVTSAERKLFGDYIIRFFLDRARDRRLVFQVHTGLAKLSGSNPLLLEPLLEEFPGVVFDLFHGGYPWIHEVGALAHNWPNVRLNLTWLPQLSSELAAAALKEWLQIVPQSYRLSWGGDCRTIEESYGALLAAKYTISKALADLVENGYIELDAAIDTAHEVLCGGGARIYGVESMVTGRAEFSRFD